MSDPKTTVASYATAGSAVLFGMTANELAAYVGMACAVLTFAVNWYYKHQHMKVLEAQAARIPFPTLEANEP